MFYFTYLEAQMYYSERYKTVEIPGVERVFTNVDEIDPTQKRVYFSDGTYMSIDEFEAITKTNIVFNLQEIPEVRQMYIENVIGIYGPSNPFFDFYLLVNDDNSIVYVDKKTKQTTTYPLTWLTTNLKIQSLSEFIPNYETSDTYMCDILTFIKLNRLSLSEVDLDNEKFKYANVWIPFRYAYQIFLIPHTYFLLTPFSYMFVFKDVDEMCEWFNFKLIDFTPEKLTVSYQGVIISGSLSSYSKWLGIQLQTKPKFYMYPLELCKYVYSHYNRVVNVTPDLHLIVDGNQVDYIDLPDKVIYLNTTLKNYFRTIDLTDFENPDWEVISIADDIVTLQLKMNCDVKVSIPNELLVAELGVSLV